MFQIPRSRLVLAMACVLWMVPEAGADLRPGRLRCEYLEDPLGIDVSRPRLSWGLESRQRGQRQSAYRIRVARTPEKLASGEGDLWDSGRVESGETHLVVYEGKSLGSGQRCYWQVDVWDQAGHGPTSSPPGRWEMGLLDPEAWQPAQWIAAKQFAEAEDGEPLQLRMPYLRRSFSIAGPVERARLYVTSLGYHNVYLNGRKVGNHEFDPVQSDHTARVCYVTHDVTDAIRQGNNMLGAWLGKGWYIGHGVEQPRPGLLAKLVVEHSDGKRTEVVSDAAWYAAPSPLLIEGPITGTGGRFGTQRYDARMTLPLWSAPDSNDGEGNDPDGRARTWQPAILLEGLLPRALSAQMMEPNRVLDRFEPVAILERGPGEYLIDFGRNVVGSFRLRLDGQEPGDELELSYSASHTGNPDLLAEIFGQVDRYLCRGAGGEEVGPHLDWRTFRFVLVKGLKSKPANSAAWAELIATDTAEASRFECSDELLNRLDRTVRYTHRCLTLGGIQVDCPHRERLGYGAEGQAAMRQALWNFEMGPFYTKWSRDFADGQDPVSGAVHYTAPYRVGSGGGPAWPGALLAFPWQCYQFLGDVRLLAEMYPAMVRWIAFLNTQADQGIMQRWSFRPGDSYWEFLGDWAPPENPPHYTPDGKSHWPCRWSTPEENQLFNTMSYAHQTQTLADIARALGKDGDADRYVASAETIREAVRRKWFDAESASFLRTDHPQTYLAFGLVSGVIPQSLEQRVLRNLESDIRQRRGGHLDTGVLGSFYLIETLLDHRRSEWIHQLVMQPEPPGWRAMLEQGATTVWEHWTPRWSSVHNSFLSIGGWFIPGIVGLELDGQSPGFQHVVIRPQPVGELTFAGATYHSVRGPIRVTWRRDTGKLQLELDIPPNVTATVHLPGDTIDTIREGGKPIAEVEGVEHLRNDGARVVLRVLSGRYAFVTGYAPGS